LPNQLTNTQNAATWSRRSLMMSSTALVAAAAFGSGSQALAQTTPATGQPQQGAGGKPPNILVIFGDDIGISQISAYTMGLMGYRTPNIDRIAAEGAIFTDS
jgi:arylsulfatase